MWLGVWLAVPNRAWPAEPSASKPAPAKPAVDLQKIFAGSEPTTIAELKAMEQRQRQLAEKVTACTVGVVVGAAHGSGVIVSADGDVLTAAHVVGEPGRKATFVLPDGRKVKGESRGVYRTLDAGLMKITEPGPWPFAEKAPANTVRVGQWCLATGHPGGFEEGRNPVVRFGRVLLVDKFAITTDCTLVGGDSGGPLFDMDGRVIGINSRIGRFLTANMHVPITAYQEAWDRLVKGEAWGHMPGTGPFLGVQGEPNSDKAKIASVGSGSPAEKAGLKAGDVIVKFGDKSVTDFAALQMLVNDRQPGDKVVMEIVRREKSMKLEVVIGERRQERPDAK